MTRILGFGLGVGLLFGSIWGGIDRVTAQTGGGICQSNRCVLVFIDGRHNVTACVPPGNPFYPANPAAFPQCS